jgi:hypothetical protein
MDLTPDLMAGAAGILLSLVFTFVPALNVWYAAKAPEAKSAIMIGSLVVVAALLAGSSCLNLWQFITCDKPGGMQLAEMLFAAIVGNQGIYGLTKNLAPASVKAAKAAQQ